MVVFIIVFSYRMDKIRFDLSARVASQQEKVVLLQSKMKEKAEEEERWQKDKEEAERQLQVALKVNIHLFHSFCNSA